MARPAQQKKLSGRSRKKAGRRKRVDYYDYSLLAVIILLTCFGLIMLYSTSSYMAEVKYGDDMYFFKKQALISAVCIVAAVVISKIDYHILGRFTTILYVSALFLMALVKITPLGQEVNGARRWLKLGIQFQPAEIAKIAVIVCLPYMIINMGRQVKTLKGCMRLAGSGGLLAAGAYILTENLSTAIIILGIGVILIFVSSPGYVQFVGMGSAGVAFITVFLAAESYRLERLAIWRNPEKYEKGFQTIQGLYAIGSGGLFGRGLGSSLQKLGFVPEAQNDMIFSIICEELGLVGAGILIIIFALLLWRLCVTAMHSRDLQGTLISAGIMGHMAIQVILNISVVTNTIPNTGITLPFISYGGTSVVFLLAEMGLALSVSSHRKEKTA